MPPSRKRINWARFDQRTIYLGTTKTHENRCIGPRPFSQCNVILLRFHKRKPKHYKIKHDLHESDLAQDPIKLVIGGNTHRKPLRMNESFWDSLIEYANIGKGVVGQVVCWLSASHIMRWLIDIRHMFTEENPKITLVVIYKLC